MSSFFTRQKFGLENGGHHRSCETIASMSAFNFGSFVSTSIASDDDRACTAAFARTSNCSSSASFEENGGTDPVQRFDIHPFCRLDVAGIVDQFAVTVIVVGCPMHSEPGDVRSNVMFSQSLGSVDVAQVELVSAMISV